MFLSSYYHRRPRLNRSMTTRRKTVRDKARDLFTRLADSAVW